MRCSPCGIDRSFSPKKESAAYTDCNTRGSLGGSSCTRPILRRFSSRCRTRARSSPDHRGWPVGAGPPFHSSRLTRVRLVSAFFADTEPALNAAEGAGILTSYPPPASHLLSGPCPPHPFLPGGVPALL